jgi:hypothetical protein
MNNAEIKAKLLERRNITAAGCWEFTGQLTPTGYGEIYVDGKNQRVHRLMYVIEHGAIPDGFYILHSCDNPPCFNPDHIRAGTQKENMKDSLDRGRNAIANHGKPWDSTGSASVFVCINGHDMRDPANVYTAPRGYRECRPCRTERSRLYAERAKAKRKASGGDAAGESNG